MSGDCVMALIEARRVRGEARPAVNEPHRIGGDGTQAPLVVVGEELCLVGSDVDADRAVALAPLAGEAEIERLTAPADRSQPSSSRPRIISNSRCARPRVLCISSRVAR